jgi:hypothetical protein
VGTLVRVKLGPAEFWLPASFSTDWLSAKRIPDLLPEELKDDAVKKPGYTTVPEGLAGQCLISS